MRSWAENLLLVAVCLLASPFAVAAPRMAFQTYAVRDLCEKDFAGTLKAAAAMGYEGVETGRFFGLDAKGLRAACDEAGLELVALQLYPHNLTEPQLSETIKFCKDCGCRRINVAWYKGSAENPNDWQLLVNVLNHAAEVCAKDGIAVAYHNHDHEFSMSIGDKCIWDWLFARDGAGGVMRQVSATPRFSNLVFQELDCGNCVLGGGDPIACLAAHPRRNPTVHIMPAIKANVKCKMENVKCGGCCAVGSANDHADWKHIIPALVADGVEWLVVKPTAHPDSLADLEASIRYLTSMNTAVANTTDTPTSAVEKTPAIGEFKLLASRRFVLDNELKLAELVPGTVMVPGVQHPPIWSVDGTPPQAAFEDGTMGLSALDRPAEGAVFVSGWLPGAHYSADFESLSDGAAAVLVWRDEKEDVLLCVRAEPGKPVSFEERVGGKTVAAKLEKPMVVPAPPFRLSGVVAGPTILIAVRKDGVVSYLGAVTFADSPDLRARRFLGSMKFGVGASLPANGRAIVSHAEMALTAGVGQADFRIVTDGPGCKPYFENGRMFCTFSARAGFKYVKSVASFDPALLDFRMEGILFTNYGDGDDLLRNDAVNHLFYDRCSKTWKACGVGWSVASNDLNPKTRRGSGIVAMECTKNPLHGITVFQAHPLLMEGGLKSEDPYFMFDETTNKWRFATSTFVEKGLRPCLWEADSWDGPYRRIAGPGPYDSTGCQIVDFGGRNFVMTANKERKLPIYAYPSLEYCGELKLDSPPFGKESPNGRVFMAFAELPDGYPFRYLMMTMDRKNFPGMPDPNWTYGSIYFYGMKPGAGSKEQTINER